MSSLYFALSHSLLLDHNLDKKIRTCYVVSHISLLNSWSWTYLVCGNAYEEEPIACHFFHLSALQDGQVEAPEERPKKMKSFFTHAVDNWDAEFYAKVNDDVYVNVGMSLIFLATNKAVSL